MIDRIGKTDDLPQELISKLGKRYVNRYTPVIDAMKSLGGSATVDEILVTQYRRHKIIPDSRRNFINTLHRMKSKGLVSHSGGKDAPWVLTKTAPT